MSSFLDDAVAAFLDSVSERAFDEPLMALLRAEGYTRVVFSHGSREFGKDVFAQRDGAQWAFQSKVGNIGQSDWERLEGQLRMLRLSDYAGPAFDTSVPRRPVLVTTGRLVGNAPLLASEYNRQARERNEPELETWERDELLSRLSGNPESVLRSQVDGPLLTALGEVERGRAMMASVETFSRRWDEFDPVRLASVGVIEASLIAEALARNERVDLACHLALCFVTRAWSSGVPQDAAVTCADAGWHLFEAYALQLWERCDERSLRTGGFMGEGQAAWITYPVRCMRVAELVGLLWLRLRQRDEEQAKLDEVAEWLAQLVYRQPGAAHPVGDRFAVSLVPPTLVLNRHKPRASKRLLEKTAVWTCDRYEGTGFGLAGPYASETEEVDRLIGGLFEHVPLRSKRRQSLIAAMCLDLAGLCGYARLYEDIRNDFLAVRLIPAILRSAQSLDQYRLTGSENRFELNPSFPDVLDKESFSGLPHHADDDSRLLLAELDRPLDLLAVSSSLRDRYFCGAIASFCA